VVLGVPLESSPAFLKAKLGPLPAIAGPPPDPGVGESHLSRTVLPWKKKLILKEAFLIRESLHGNTYFDLPRSPRPA